MEFEVEFKRLYRPLCLYALQYTQQTDEAEDIVQQAFADVWEKLHAGELIANLKAYLYQAVKNRSIHFAARKREEILTDELPDNLSDTTDEERIALAERDARLWSAIDRLPSERRRIFLLSKRDGLKYQEIAEELHISVKTVEVQISKALKALRETAIRIYTFFFG
ncbi:RNA polymerase subunit sigma-70 [Parabacteroides sp. An277]|uniref:RNA polymerase sigma-70 factor n=1 Tax=Parabacteroides sp. An277 TaxID=1965619 RepID=UPI000B38ADF4|nr:RNA polymerase sigma-70 factor [Parabacteroides sp. An277]OUO50979.1 RNA polymerase subunit sigma-70 [Parabacteroides sp. An277]